MDLKGTGENIQPTATDISKARRPTSGAHPEATEEKLDVWRIQLINLVYLLSSYFMDIQYWEGVKSEKDTFDRLVRTLRKLALMPGHDGSLLIRFRGFPGADKGSGKADYTVLFGRIAVDTGIANAVTYRQGIHMTHLSGRLTRSFGIFSDHGIDTLYLKLPGPNSKELQRLRVCLHIISHYKLALKTNTPLNFEKDGQQVTLPLLYDEQNRPDLNLILLAGLNGLTPRAAERLVRQVSAWIQDDAPQAGLDQQIGVYNTIFKIKSLREKLVRPPIEINNVTWLKFDRGQKVVLEDGNGIEEQNLVPQSLKEAFGEVTDDAVRYPESIAAINPESIDSAYVSERLQKAFDLIDAIETRSEGWEILEEVIQSIQGRFELAGESVFDSMVVEGDVLKVQAEGKEIIIEGLNGDLLTRIVYYQDRSALKSKMRATAGCDIDFNGENLEHFARNFDAPAEEISAVIDLLKSCFDSDGRFLKPVFDKNIAEFARYSKPVFAILWQYLKEPLERKDRVAFLNSLQVLVTRMQSVKSTIRILLADFGHDPGRVSFSDRNAPMFACLLLRKFNKEMNLDIEVTPEEVLRVRQGLDPGSVAVAAEFIESNAEIFLEKMKSIQREILAALDPAVAADKSMPLRYLLSLEREVYMLLALVGGPTALSAIREAVRQYGNPGAKVYRFEGSSAHLPALLQHFKLAVRALGRIGEKDDLALLEDIKKRQRGFVRLSPDPQHADLVKRVMGWVDTARRNIFPNEALDLPPLER